MAAKKSRLFMMVQERAAAKKEAEEEKRRQQQNSIPYVPNDCVHSIFDRLPLQSLQRSRCVCKPWYKIINSSKFIDAHLNRSEITLVFLSNVKTDPYLIPQVPQENPNTFSVEANLVEVKPVSIFKQPISNPRPKYKIKYMKIRDGKCEIIDYNATCLGQVRASCNGLVVLDNMLKKGSLIALNPVIRKMIVLPLGTIFPSDKESYGLAFCNSKKQFKLVHLFLDESQYIGCEILDIGTRSWRVVDEPCVGLISQFGFRPVHAIGALHWVPHADQSEYVVSLSIDDEKFHKILLPKSSRSYDGIVEIRGLLGFVIHKEAYQIDVWVLKSLFVGQEWTKHHSIDVSQFPRVYLRDMFPLCCTKSDSELVFRSMRDCSLHTYNFRSRAMRKVEMEKGLVPFRVQFIPHVNSLVSWETHGEGEHMDDYDL